MFSFDIWFRLISAYLIPSVFGLLDLEELANIQYAIDIRDKPLLLEEIGGHEGVLLSSRFGQLYQCHYEAVTGTNSQNAEEENVAKAEVVDLLKPLEEKPCLVQTTGWWTYELCYKKEIKQYHLEEGKISGGIISLGHYVTEFNWNDINLKSRPEYVGRYHSQEYTNGSVCDLTGELRSTSVRLKCQNGIVSDEIETVEEPTTCNYIVTVHTNRICQHPQLRIVAQKKSVPITCQPLLNDEEYAQYTEFHNKDSTSSSQKESLATEAKPERETTDEKPGTSASRKDSIFIMAEASNDIVDNGDELKRVIVGKIVKKLKDSLDNEKKDKEKEEAEDTEAALQEPDNAVVDELPETKKHSAEEQNNQNNRNLASRQKKEPNQDESSKQTKPLDASSELQKTLEGFISAVNSELETLAAEDVTAAGEDINEKEEEQMVNDELSRKQELVAEEKDIYQNSGETDKQNVEEKSSSDKDADTEEVEGSYIKWEGQGNQIQQITIDTGMKIKVRQKNKDNENEDEKDSTDDSDIKENSKTKLSTPPTRKMEVRIINAAYYNKDGKPVSVYADDPNPSIERMVLALLQRNDEELAEFEKQKRMEDNYRFKWSNSKKRKEKDWNTEN